MSREEFPPEVWMIATLKEILEVQKMSNQQLQEMKGELSTIRKSQEKSTLHERYDIDLSVTHTNEKIADFVKLGLEIDSIHILPVPSAINIKLRGITDKTINLSIGEDYTLSGYLITRILVTNSAGSGTAYIHVYGR